MTKESAEKLIKLNKESYNKIADHFSITRGYIWPDLKNLAEHIHNNYKVLDVGCGNGRLYEELAPKNVEYYGVDSCQKLIDIARERYGKNHASRFGVFDIFNMPFQEGQFDAIFTIAVINHLPTRELQKKALLKLNKLLKPDGTLLMTNWNLWRPTLSKKSVFYYALNKLHLSAKEWKKKYLVDKKDFTFKDVMTEWQTGKGKSPLYYYAFSLTELDNLVKECGFEISDSYYSKKGKKVNWNQGGNLVTVARKQ